MNDLVILGAGGVGRQVAQITRDINSVAATWNLVGYLDDDLSRMGERVAGITVLGDPDWLCLHCNVHVAIAIGDSPARFKAYRRLKAIRHRRIATLVHPSAWRGMRVVIGTGTIVYANAVLDPDVTIGNGSIINKVCTVGHDASVGDFVTLGPGVNLGGGVHVGSGSCFGINSATIHGLHIGDWSVVGAGAVVVDDLPANVIAVGVPARVVRTRDAGWYS
ncbi:MAG: NeuD/PglB/VioB family sugar acetyltransferase [Anaerolineae bacterium]|jgi:sugar O-acyltransferase (sialic acid O-acetyltransferase NeuD family)